MDLEAGRKKSVYEDIFISYHAEDDVQSTYAGSLFHNNRNYHLSPYKNNVSERPLCSLNLHVNIQSLSIMILLAHSFKCLL